jgi:hypothetical protein
MINERTGEIQLDSGLRILPWWPKEALLASPLAAGMSERKKGPGWVDVKVPPQRIGGRAYIMVLHFHDDRLAGLHLMDDDPAFGDSWETADEQGRKRAHDAALAATLGEPPYEYAWGEAGSTYDPRGDVSDIYVRYRPVSP